MFESETRVNWEKDFDHPTMARDSDWLTSRNSIRKCYVRRYNGQYQKDRTEVVGSGYMPVSATHDVPLRCSLVLKGRDKIIQPHFGVGLSVYCSLALRLPRNKVSLHSPNLYFTKGELSFQKDRTLHQSTGHSSVLSCLNQFH